MIGPLVFVLISLTLLYVAAMDRELIVDRRSLIGLTVGCVSCIALLSSDMRSKALTWLGGYSYAIFLFHVLFAATSRFVLGRLGVKDESVLVLGGVALWLAGAGGVVDGFQPVQFHFGVVSWRAGGEEETSGAHHPGGAAQSS